MARPQRIAPDTYEYRGYRITVSKHPLNPIARIYQHGKLVGCALDLAGARAVVDMTLEAKGV